MARCFKCKAPGYHQWRICSDGPWRWVCIDCDVELNRIALLWAYPRKGASMFEAYRKRQLKRKRATDGHNT